MVVVATEIEVRGPFWDYKCIKKMLKTGEATVNVYDKLKGIGMHPYEEIYFDYKEIERAEAASKTRSLMR